MVKKKDEEMVVKEEKTVSKKNEKKDKKMAILKEKMEVDKKIDALKVERKATKDKAKRKSLKSEIKELKNVRDKIGKKRTFLRDVSDEMRLVRWPQKGEIVKYSLACLIFVAFFALFYYGIDALFALVTGMNN